MAKIYSPNRSYTGISASVAFANGVGETKDKNLIAWFRAKGYSIGKPLQATLSVSATQTPDTELVALQNKLKEMGVSKKDIEGKEAEELKELIKNLEDINKDDD